MEGHGGGVMRPFHDQKVGGSKPNMIRAHWLKMRDDFIQLKKMHIVPNQRATAVFRKELKDSLFAVI